MSTAERLAAAEVQRNEWGGLLAVEELPGPAEAEGQQAEGVLK